MRGAQLFYVKHANLLKWIQGPILSLKTSHRSPLQADLLNHPLITAELVDLSRLIPYRYRLRDVQQISFRILLRLLEKSIICPFLRVEHQSDLIIS